MKTKLKTLTVATGLALSVMSGVAQANSLATSVLDITGFTIKYTGGAQVDKSNFSLLTISDSADISAALNPPGGAPITASGASANDPASAATNALQTWRNCPRMAVSMLPSTSLKRKRRTR